MVAMLTKSACIGGFTPGVINERWGMRTLRDQTREPASVAVSRPLASDVAIATHPEDLLDQVLHDNGKCGCFGN